MKIQFTTSVIVCAKMELGLFIFVSFLGLYLFFRKHHETLEKVLLDPIFMINIEM